MKLLVCKQCHNGINQGDADAIQHIWEAGRLGLGENDTEKMDFPALKLQEAMDIFTEAAYGEKLKSES